MNANLAPQQIVGQGLIPGMLTVDPEKTTPLATSSYNWLTNKNVRLQEEITKMLPPPSWSGPPGGDQKMEVPFL